MRILILNQFFYPDSAATSQLLTDVVRGMAAEGHSVRVICGSTSYAEAEDGRRPPSVETVRLRALPFGRNTLGRLASYASFFLGALWHGILGPKPDIVLTLTTPPALSLIGAAVQAISRARHYIWEMDIYPDIAVDLGVLPAHSWITRIVGAIIDYSRRKADGIIALGECMRARLIHRGVDPARIHIAENWADGHQIHPLPFLTRQPIQLLYSGNLGRAHDTATLKTAILHFASDSRFHFAFAGGGAQRKPLETLCRAAALPNVTFSSYRPYAELTRSFGACHIGVVTQDPATVGSVVPSKTYGLLAAGRPILFIGPRAATPARVISRFRCGWQIDPGDPIALITLLEHLASHPEEIREAGERGREAFLQNYDLPIGVARICAILGLSQPEPRPEAVSVRRAMAGD